MARERIVSRTVKTYEYKVVGINPNNREISEKFLKATGEKPTEKELKEMFTTKEFSPFLVDFVDYTEDLYVMSELDFIKYAHKAEDGKRAISTKSSENDATENDTNNA